MKWFTFKWFLLFVFLGGLEKTVQAQIAAWDFFGQTSPATFAATTYNVNLVATGTNKNITRGAGAASSSASNSFRTVGFKNDGISVSNTDYFQVTLSPSSGYALSLSTIDANFNGTATYAVSPGVSNQFAYSLDGTTFTLVGSPQVLIGQPVALSQINLSSITALQNIASGTTVYIRYYASGQTTTGGWGFYSSATGSNGLAIGGTLTAVAATPTISSLSPNTANAGDLDLNLTVNGTNFLNTSFVNWNGSARATTFVSANQLTAVIPRSDLSTIKTAAITVTTPSALASSNAQNFNVLTPNVPSLSLTAPLPSFGSVCTNTTAGPNSFKIDGYKLDGSNILVNALAGFAFSESSNGPFSNTLSFGYSGNSLASKTIYVQFMPTAIQSYNGNITLSGGGIAGSYPVPDTGTGVNTGPSIITVTPATSVGPTTATVGGSITAYGCNAISAYGIEYSANSGFATGTGTQTASSNINNGSFSATISGLSPNTKYYYHAYAVSGGTTTYGTEQSFIETPLPVLMSAQPGLSYTQDFADIATWSNFFITGNGANHFGGLSAITVGAIPDGKTITTSTNSFQGAMFGSSGGLQRGTDQNPATQSIVLLATGTNDNTTAAAIDFYLDFTGLNAGTLSFDYQSLINSLGTGANDRASSLRVYATVDGINFMDLTNADVLNFINNTPISGSKANIPLPSIFNNSATARLRFYCYNGTGGSNGSRPKISIDNINVTAVATTPCSKPNAPATALVFGNITDTTVAGSFTASASSTPTDNYLVVASVNNSLTKNPDDGQIYNLGDNLGDGTVVAKGGATSFTASGLSASTLYTFFIFPINSICTGGPLYDTTTVLIGQATTKAGLPTCAAPIAQPTAYTAGTVGTNSIAGSFTATSADEYLVLVNTSSTFTGTLANGQLYSNGDVIGNATVVQRSNATTFTATGLSPNTTYYFYIFSANTQACVNGPAYNPTSPLMASQTTNPLPTCATPSAQPTQLTFNASNTAISGAFAPASGADDYLVVMSTNPTITQAPIDATDYNMGDNFGGGTIVANSLATSFMVSNLAAGTQYYFYIFSANKNCSGGTKYVATSPLKSSIATTSVLANNYYFGNIHSHSDYSDGNKDHQGYTPADDYAYAKTAQCLDFLGISEHNHYSGGDPGNTITNYHMGSSQANTFTANNPGFLAMYGMEWGVISGGGHVVVYGDGMDKLFGWESGSGGWGPTDNYDVYVPKSIYTGTTGLFKTVNDYIANNTFATLAHPNQTDFNNLAGIAYDASADSAITGSAIETGPATSTNTTYSNPSGTSLGYLTYFQNLLAKGYHLGPTTDHDNHNTTFGHTTYARTAVLAPTLTKTDVVKAFRNMNFYSTQDCDTKVDFTINTRPMGSIMAGRYSPNIAVTLTDATTSTMNAIIKIMYGVPGSGILAAKIDSVIGNKLVFADNSLANFATGYYYADITNGTARMITSPIWYTRNDSTSTVVLPIMLGSFTAQKVNTDVQLTWTTAQETNTKTFVIERSVDGVNWTAIGNQPAAGSSVAPINYIFYDNKPINGLNYYRLQEVDMDGKAYYSTTRSVLFASRFQVSVSPNPAHDFINLYVTNTASEIYQVQLMDNNGKLLQKITSIQQHLQISTSALAKGIYFIKFLSNNIASIQKIIIE